jgi:hypothetical protein
MVHSLSEADKSAPPESAPSVIRHEYRYRTQPQKVTKDHPSFFSASPCHPEANSWSGTHVPTSTFWPRSLVVLVALVVLAFDQASADVDLRGRQHKPQYSGPV